MDIMCPVCGARREIADRDIDAGPVDFACDSCATWYVATRSGLRAVSSRAALDVRMHRLRGDFQEWAPGLEPAPAPAFADIALPMILRAPTRPRGADRLPLPRPALLAHGEAAARAEAAARDSDASDSLPPTAAEVHHRPAPSGRRWTPARVAIASVAVLAGFALVRGLSDTARTRDVETPAVASPRAESKPAETALRVETPSIAATAEVAAPQPSSAEEPAGTPAAAAAAADHGALAGSPEPPLPGVEGRGVGPADPYADDPSGAAPPTPASPAVAPPPPGLSDAMSAAVGKPSITPTAIAAAPPAPPEPIAAPPAGPSREAIVAGLRSVEGSLWACLTSPGPTQAVRVTVTIAPSGVVTRALVSGAFAGTPEGSCFARVYRTARVAPFEGESITVHRSLMTPR